VLSSELGCWEEEMQMRGLDLDVPVAGAEFGVRV